MDCVGSRRAGVMAAAIQVAMDRADA